MVTRLQAFDYVSIYFHDQRDVNNSINLAVDQQKGLLVVPDVDKTRLPDAWSVHAHNSSQGPMTLRLRPSLSSSTLKQRPLSAIFVGGASTNSNLPELPEPPSPGGSSSSARSSSTHSGLPSPPATNSTGSGSTGDHSTNGGSLRLRDRTVSLPPQALFTDTHSNPDKSMNNTFNDNSTSQSSPRTHEGDQDDEDESAHRASNRDPATQKSPSENVLALERVRSLAQKNRVALDKLTSYSRLSPSPAPSSSRISSAHRERSPFPQSSSRSQVTSPRGAPDTLSGSETEREQNADSYDEHEDTITPPTSALSPKNNSTSSRARISSTPQSPPRPFSGRSDLSDSPSRQRRISAPVTSPERVFHSPSRESSGAERQEANGFGPRSGRTPIKTLNSAVVDHLYERDRQRDRGGHDVTKAALAAVASARESLNSGRRSRAALPREFREREGERQSLDYRSPTTPPTPNRQRLQLESLDQNVYIARGSPSPKSSGSLMLSGSPNGLGDQLGPRRTPRKRSGTIRGGLDNAAPNSPGLTLEDRAAERRAVMRGADSPGAARSLVGQGFKAAGIVRRKESLDAGRAEEGSEEVSGIESAGLRRRSRLSSMVGAVASALGPKGKGKARDVQEWVDAGAEADRESDPRTNNLSGGAATPSVRRSSTYNRPNHISAQGDSHLDHRERERDGTHARVGYAAHHRATASMANYQPSSTYGDGDEDGQALRSAPAGSRAFRSPYTPPTPLEREKERLEAGSRQGGRYSPLSTNNRHMTPTPVYRQPSPSPVLQGHVAQSDHGRLMMESLRTFESQLLRLPNTTAVPELFKNAQNIAHTAEKLNMLLRGSTNRALEAQIDAEVGDGDGELGAEVWRRVGGEYRESLRVSDELVRTVTSFMLSMGKVLKETSVDEFGRHGREPSVDPEERRRDSVRRSLDERRSMEGRRSVASQRSSEHTNDSIRRLTPRAEAAIPSAARPSSSLAFTRDRLGVADPSSQSSGATLHRNFTDPHAFRRLARQERPEPQDLRVSIADSAGSTETIHGPDIPPSPVSRLSHERSRTLPHLSMPPPPPPKTQQSLSSGSASSGSHPNSASERSARRRSGLAFNSNSRSGVPPMISAIASPNATTAITAHTVSSPERPTIPLSQTDSSDSGPKPKAVTFSRSSNVSMSALAGLQQQDSRKRTTSTSSSNAGDATARFSPIVKKSISASDAEGAKTALNRARASLEARRPPETDTPPPSSRRERRRTITEIFS